MKEFNLGETVICKCTVKDLDGKLHDPSTSMKITIDHASNGIEVDNVDMVRVSEGVYTYDYLLPTSNGGHKVDVKYTAIDGTRVSISTDEFKTKR